MAKAAHESATNSAYDLIDIGPNLAHESFQADLADVIQRARAVGVTQMVVTGSDSDSALAAADYGRQYPGQLFATAGLHPHHANAWGGATLTLFRELAARSEVVALGEMGLDFFRDISPRAAQERAFHEQLQLAVELQFPVFLHQRDAHARFLPILKEYRDALPCAVAHCFTGSGDELNDYLDLDLHIGITGWICDERRGVHLLDIVDRIPANRLMLETDSPYLMPRNIRPRPKTRRNEPANLPYVLAAVAAARCEPEAIVAAASSATARSFFKLPEPNSVNTGTQ